MLLYATPRARSPATLDTLRLVPAFGIGTSVVAIAAFANDGLTGIANRHRFDERGRC